MEDGGFIFFFISVFVLLGRKLSVYVEEDNLVRELRMLLEIMLNFELEFRIGFKWMLRVKKQGVFYFDLIKLQYFISFKKLFSLVNILVQKYGGKNRNIE